MSAPPILAVLGIVLSAALCGPARAGEAPIPRGRLGWALEPRVQRAERIAPSPHDPDKIWIATEAGIMQTADDGATWTLLPKTSRAELGRVSDILFSRFDLNTVFIASREKGVLRSDDAGKTWCVIGNAEKGMASSDVRKLYSLPDDWELRTLYATHGDAAAGISRSWDGGEHWTQPTHEFFADELLFFKTVMLLAGVRKSEEDVHSIFRSVDGGQLWADEYRDADIAAAAMPKIKIYPQYVAEQKGGIRDTADFSSHGPEEGGRWASLFTAFSGDGSVETLYAYDPYKQGLLASNDGFRTWWTENENLFVGGLIKEGAHVCANANGTAFYAMINGNVYVARPFADRGPLLSGVKATPGVIRVPSDALQKAMIQAKGKNWPAENLSFLVSARVLPPRGGQIKRVDCDLRPLRLAPTQLFDDGKHGDGAAGDGLYAAHVAAGSQCLGHDPVKRPKVPGQTTCSITAADNNGRSTTAPLVISVFPMHEPWTLWNGDSERHGWPLKHFQPIGSGGRVTQIAMGAHAGERCLRFVSTGGRWAVGWGQDYDGLNASVADYLVFWMKLSAPADRDIKCFLFDGRGGERMANASAEVWLLRDGYLKPGVKGWQQVRIPMALLRKRTGFFYTLVGGIAFGGESAKGTEFYIDDVGFE